MTKGTATPALPSSLSCCLKKAQKLLGGGRGKYSWKEYLRNHKLSGNLQVFLKGLESVQYNKKKINHCLTFKKYTEKEKYNEMFSLQQKHESQSNEVFHLLTQETIRRHRTNSTGDYRNTGTIKHCNITSFVPLKGLTPCTKILNALSCDTKFMGGHYVALASCLDQAPADQTKSERSSVSYANSETGHFLPLNRRCTATRRSLTT